MLFDRAKAQDILNALKITLSPEQAEVFWDEERVLVMAGGEGAGKSFVGALRAFVLTVTTPVELGWFVGADMEDARKEMDYFIDWSDKLGILDRSNSTIPSARTERCLVRLDLSRITGKVAVAETVSGYDPLKIGRDQPDWIVGCEVSRWEKEVFDRCYGRLARKYPRAWGFFSGSFEESIGWFPETWALGQGPNEMDLSSHSLPSWANRSIYPGGADDAAIVQLRNSMSESRFLARHAGRPSPPRDAVLPEFKYRLHVWPVTTNPAYPVYLFIDPGTTVYCILYVQIVGGEVHVLDEIYQPQASHDSVINSAMANELWKYVGGGVIDVAGKQHHGGFMSPEQAWARDTGLRLKSQYLKVDQEVERLRSILHLNPITQRARLLIHPRCKGIISEMGGGQSPNPSGGLWRMKGGSPDNHNDHACKALAYGLAQYYGTNTPPLLDEQDGPDGGALTYLKERPTTVAMDRLEKMLRGSR